MADKVVKKRFGFFAVEKGFIELDQLIQAMKIQVNEDIQLKPHRRIGEILVELGLMNQSQVEEILAELDYLDNQWPAQ